MQSFTYIYKAQECQATFVHLNEEFSNRFRIHNDDKTFIIDPVNYDKTIWLQSEGLRLPYDLIQAIGEGLEAAGIY
jgi:hypothetical protein